MIKTLALAALTTFTLTVSGAVAQTGDATAGEGHFRSCRSCHGITGADGTVIQRGGRTGPNLFGLPGRAVGSEAGFGYSPSLAQLGATGAVWNQALFVEYTADPTAFLRAHLNDATARSAMNFRLTSGAADLWAYLVSVSPAAAN